MSHGGGDSGRWLVSYADLITLMMALFLVLYTMGQVDIARYRALAEAFRDALNGKGGIPASVVDTGINTEGAGTGEARPDPVNPDEGFRCGQPTAWTSPATFRACSSRLASATVSACRTTSRA
jgi:chemotaxis protein MotB